MKTNNKKCLHISWLIGWFFVAVIAGIALSRFESEKFASLSWLILGIGLLIISLISRRRALVLLAIGAGLLVGLSRGSLGQQDLNAYQPLTDQQQTVRGVLAEDAAFSAQGEQRLKLKNVEIGGQKLPGQLWVSTPSQVEIKRSDEIEVRGKLTDGFGNFPAAIYRANLVKVERIDNADIAREIRDKFAAAVRKVIGEPEASLGLGYLVGQRTALPEDLNEKLRILGLTHIVVASGYNLSILVRFARRRLAHISKYSSVMAGLLLTAAFILITGFSPSMTRAGLVTALALLAWYFGRAIHPLVLLSLAAGATALINPAYVWGDLGWYLSFAAFGGVIVLAPLLQSYFFGDKKPGGLVQILFETSSAQLATMPIVALAFGQYAPLAIISNLLILPLVSFAMAFTFVAGLSALTFGSSLAWLALPAEWLLKYMTLVVDRLARLPVAVAEVSFSVGALIGSYLALILLIVFLKRRTRHSFYDDNIVE